ncbi:MAG: hypothetical protein GX442_12800 [Candidatus Riflebacteria bacterium]|nr:hypothetical protein [Candidatus Riflebacteria bacterium]
MKTRRGWFGVLSLLWFLAVAIVAHTGEMVSPENGFRMVWPSRWERLTQGVNPSVALCLMAGKETQALQLIILPDIPSPDAFLKPADVPQKFLGAVDGKNLLGDSLVKIGGTPARRMIYRQKDDGVAVFTIVVAQNRAYLLIGTFKGMPQKAAEKAYDSLLAGFRLEAATTNQARHPAPTPTAGSAPPPPPTGPTTPATGNDFGSDF